MLLPVMRQEEPDFDPDAPDDPPRDETAECHARCNDLYEQHRDMWYDRCGVLDKNPCLSLAQIAIMDCTAKCSADPNGAPDAMICDMYIVMQTVVVQFPIHAD